MTKTTTKTDTDFYAITIENLETASKEIRETERFAERARSVSAVCEAHDRCSAAAEYLRNVERAGDIVIDSELREEIAMVAQVWRARLRRLTFRIAERYREEVKRAEG